MEGAAAETGLAEVHEDEEEQEQVDAESESESDSEPDSDVIEEDQIPLPVQEPVIAVVAEEVEAILGKQQTELMKRANDTLKITEDMMIKI